MIVVGLLAVTAPLLSVARTVNTWLPGETFFHVSAYGALVSEPSTVDPSRNSTLVTAPSGSLALALKVIVGFHEKTAPSVGLMMLAVGGALDDALTVTPTGVLVVAAPESSVARAVRVYVPAATPAQV